MKTIEKKGLEAMAKEAGLDLSSLPYRCKHNHACNQISAVEAASVGRPSTGPGHPSAEHLRSVLIHTLNHNSSSCTRDARPGRTEWLAANPQQPSMSKKTRRMKNPERLAQSKKKPLKARYISGNTRIQMYREE